jgi:monofunctional biosynthetic peptidoglycan transglycosylase
MRRRSTLVLRRLGLALIVLAALPFVLTVLYSVVNPVSTLMVGRWLTGQPVTRSWVPLDAMSPPLVRAVVVSEDARFCMHWGVDTAQLSEVLDGFMAGEETRGASTISMQTAKNLFLWPGRSYLRKALEIPIALWLDLVLSKDRLLEIYLNIAEFSPGVFGVEAGAERAFGKPAAKIGPAEAALMATTLPDPDGRNPGQPSSGHRQLAGRVTREVGRSDWVFYCLEPRIRP